MTRRWPTGISHTPAGWRLSLRRKGFPLWQKRLKPSLSLEEVEKELAAARKSLHAGKGAATAGTLKGDVDRYLRDYMGGRPGHNERQRHLELWVTALGAQTWRTTITRDDVSRTLNTWKASGLAADTVNKRRTALLALYHALDGRGGSNPVRETKKFRAPDPLPRGLAYDLIEKTLKKMPACKTQARLRVMAYTGMRHGQLMRLTPDDWDHKGKTLTVPGTGKGRGTKPYVIPLTEQAQAALKTFDALEAWGVFTWAPMARMWRDAATKAKLPKGTVPYDLRHSFGTEMFRVTGDIKAVKELMGHSTLAMTERYTLAAVPARQRAAILAFEQARAKVATKVASRGKPRKKKAS